MQSVLEAAMLPAMGRYDDPQNVVFRSFVVGGRCQQPDTSGPSATRTWTSKRHLQGFEHFSSLSGELDRHKIIAHPGCHPGRVALDPPGPPGQADR